MSKRDEPVPVENRVRIHDRGAVRNCLVLCASILIVACQPAPEERFSRAESLYSESDYGAVRIELKNALQDRPDYPEARYLLGRASYQLADFPAAQSEFERALESGLDHPDVWAELGKVLLAQGDAEAALERVVPNIAVETASAPQIVVLAEIFLALGNLVEADELYVRVLNIDPSAPGGLIGRAVIARENSDLKSAAAFLDKAQELNPDSDLVWRARGNYLRSNLDFVGAAEAYDQAIRLETGSTPAADRMIVRVNRLTSLLDAGKFDEAEDNFDILVGDNPDHPVYRFLRGRLAYARGNYSLAQEELRAYLADIPDDLRGYALLGAVNFSQNHLHQAEEYLSRATRNRVGGQATARLLAETRLRLNKPGEALTALGALGQAGQADPEMLTMYGRAELGLGNTAAALEYFEKGAAIEGRDPVVSLSLAAGFFASNENERAIEILEGIPEHEDARFRREALLMAAHIRDGDREAAIAVGKTLLAEHPNDAGAQAMVGVLWQTLGDFVEARLALEQAITIDPGNVSANYALSQLEIIEGNLDSAEKLLGSLLNKSPTFMPALVTLSEILIKSGRLNEISPRIQAAIDADDATLEPRLLQIRVALLNKDPGSALRAIADARGEFPDDARLLHAEGSAFLQQGQYEAALASFRRAANGDRDNATFQLDFASLSFRTGDLRAAGESIARYRELQPDDFRGLAIDAGVRAKQGDIDGARAAISEYSSANPAQRNVLVLAGDVEMAGGNAAAAVAHYEAAFADKQSRELVLRLARAYQETEPPRALKSLALWLEANPDDPEVRRAYAQYLEAQGETEDAVEEYERLLQSQGDDPVALNNLAWQYADAGREGAVELAERAHKLAPDNGSITDTLAWILFQKGETSRALSLLQKAVEQSPDNLEIRFHLAAAHASAGNRERASAIINNLLKQDRAFPSRSEAEQLARNL